MDLLSPCKMCLQCLPVFSSISPPSSPHPASAVAPVPSHTTSEKVTNSCASAFATNSSENDFQEGEKPSFSDASLSHDHQHQDLPLSEHAKMLGSPVHPSAETKPLAKGDNNHVHHEYTSHDGNQEASNNTVPSKDVEFSIPGLRPLPSPTTPTPIGLGHIVGQHAASHHFHHQVNSGHNEGHSFFHIHSHDKAPPLHPSSPSTQDEQHVHPPLSSSCDGGEEHAHHQPSHKQNIDAQDDGYHASPFESSQDVHGHHTNVDDLETSHSMPHIDLASAAHDEYNSFNAMNWSSSTLETSQSEPIEGVGGGHVRRRDQLKHRLKDLRNQLKEGGQHLKEEGSKHLQSMVTNMNKQVQQIEESFIVPHT